MGGWCSLPVSGARSETEEYWDKALVEQKALTYPTRHEDFWWKKTFARALPGVYDAATMEQLPAAKSGVWHDISRPK